MTVDLLDLKDPRVLQDPLEVEEKLVCLDKMEPKELKEKQEHLAQRAQLDLLGHRVSREQRVKLEVLALGVKVDHRDQEDLLGKMVNKVNEEILVILVVLDQLGPKDKQVKLDNEGRLGNVE